MNEMLNSNLILLDYDAENKNEVFYKATELLFENGIIESKELMIEELQKREESGSTELEFGFAIPHAKSENIKRASIVFIRLKKGILWEESKVDNIFVLAIPKKDQVDTHLKILVSLSRKIMKDEFINQIKSSQNKSEIVNLIIKEN